MVPVFGTDSVPLMPCEEKRARLLCERKQAFPFWKKGVFCIRLLKEPSARKYQEVVVGIDPGSKREGYTVATERRVVMNLLTNTPGDVREKVETRRMMRRGRRFRKTPCRKNRENRARGGLPPSTKARWQAKLRILNFLATLFRVTIVRVEDISARTKKGQRKWNVSFSPLEVGKAWFYGEVGKRFTLKTNPGFDTHQHRTSRGFTKTSKKLSDTWEAHNVDSHCLCEMQVGDLKPVKVIHRVDFYAFRRRQLHLLVPAKGGLRRENGSTRSMGLKRGSLVKHPGYGVTYMGGTSAGRISLHSVDTGKRLTRSAQAQDVTFLTYTSWRTRLLPVPKGRVPALEKKR